MAYVFSIAVINYHKLRTLKQRYKVLAGLTGFSVLGLAGKLKVSAI